MAALVAGIHVLTGIQVLTGIHDLKASGIKDVDGRNKSAMTRECES